MGSQAHCYTEAVQCCSRLCECPAPAPGDCCCCCCCFCCCCCEPASCTRTTYSRLPSNAPRAWCSGTSAGGGGSTVPPPPPPPPPPLPSPPPRLGTCAAPTTAGCAVFPLLLLPALAVVAAAAAAPDASPLACRGSAGAVASGRSSPILKVTVSSVVRLLPLFPPIPECSFSQAVRPCKFREPVCASGGSR